MTDVPAENTAVVAAPGTTDDDDGDSRTGPGPAPRRRTVRRRWIALAVVVVLGVVPVLVVQGVGQSHVRASVDDVAPAPVALVLGAGLRPDGSPSVYLGRRLARAAELYAAGTVRVILVSGDNSRVGYDEPTAMRNALVAAGVPAEHVVADFAGFDTHDSCVRARQVFGVEGAVVITQTYHLRRALFSCAAAGIDVQGSGVSAASVRPAQAALWRAREVLASWKTAWDAATGRSPVYLGEFETGVTDALSEA